MRLTGEPWQTPADKTGCILKAEVGPTELRHRPVVVNVRALETFAIVLTGMLLALVDIQLAVFSLIACTDKKTHVLKEITGLSESFHVKQNKQTHIS